MWGGGSLSSLELGTRVWSSGSCSSLMSQWESLFTSALLTSCSSSVSVGQSMMSGSRFRPREKAWCETADDGVQWHPVSVGHKGFEDGPKKSEMAYDGVRWRRVSVGEGGWRRLRCSIWSWFSVEDGGWRCLVVPYVMMAGSGTKKKKMIVSLENSF